MGPDVEKYGEVAEFVRRPELDAYKEETEALAETGKCEGGCERHHGEVKCVRVYDKRDGRDWGYFSYCEEARDEDARRGLGFVDA